MFCGWLVVIRGTRDGGIAGVTKVVDGMVVAHFIYSFLLESSG